MAGYSIPNYSDPQTLTQHYGRYLKTYNALGKSARDRAILEQIWNDAFRSGNFSEQPFEYSYNQEVPKDIKIPETSKASTTSGSSTASTSGNSGLKKSSIPKKKLADSTLREIGQKVVNGAKSVGNSAINLGRNALSGLSGLSGAGIGGDIAAGLSASAAPIAAGALWAFANGSRMDKNGTTKQLADEMNQVFKAGMYVDDEGNYVDANTNEIVDPGSAEKRIDALNQTPVSNAPIGASSPEMEYPAEEVPSISSVDGGYAEYEKPTATPTQIAVTPATGAIVQNPLDALNGISDADLATAVIRGKYGNGLDRRKALGDRYAAVQSLVNQKMQKAAPKTELIDIGNGVVYNPATGKAQQLEPATEDQLRGQVF